MIYKIFAFFYNYLLKSANKQKEKKYRNIFNIHCAARLNYIENIWFKGNITIGGNTYINSGRFTSGNKSSITIGEWCAIGHNVTIMAWTHDTIYSTGEENRRPTIQKDIIIGNNVWIGSNVYIREGVKIGNNVIIGANSVVTKNLPDNTVCAGAPAKIIKYKE